MNNDLNDKELREKIKLLDSSYPKELGNSDEVWLDIQQKLQSRETRITGYVLAIAASIIATIIVLSLLTISIKEKDEVITFKTESVQDIYIEERSINETRSEKEAMHYLNEQCIAERPACHSSEFIELKKELDDVNHVLLDIQTQMKLFGADPALVQAQIIAENQKAYILKELIQMLRS